MDNNPLKVLITGGTGFVGGYLLDKLNEDSTRCIVTTRNAARARKKLGNRIVDAVEWQDANRPPELSSHEDIDAVVNLMGDNVAARWTAKKKQAIRESRIVGTRRLVDAILARPRKPRVFVSASAVGYYPDEGDRVITEESPPCDRFLSDICRDWELETERLQGHDIRIVILRIGIVLGKGGGAIGSLLPLFKWCLGGPLGSGRHYMPWIHVKDVAGLIHWAIHNEPAQGVYNATAPNPVTNREFTKAFARAVGRPAFLPAPRFGVRLVAGEFANELFMSQRVVPEAALSDGFQFEFTGIDAALKDII
ncbi:MAG: TIGR01777 family oxidoreductase [Planctomycetota bacterium]